MRASAGRHALLCDHLHAPGHCHHAHLRPLLGDLHDLCPRLVLGRRYLLLFHDLCHYCHALSRLREMPRPLRRGRLCCLYLCLELKRQNY